jgi:hypothetical protein
VAGAIHIEDQPALALRILQASQRVIRSALATYQDRFHTRIQARLAPATCTRLDALLTTEMHPDPDADDTLPAASQRTTLQLLKADAGPVQVATAYAEVAKLEHLRALALPLDLFTGIPMPLLRTYAQQVQMHRFGQMSLLASHNVPGNGDRTTSIYDTDDQGHAFSSDGTAIHDEFDGRLRKRPGPQAAVGSPARRRCLL